MLTFIEGEYVLCIRAIKQLEDHRKYIVAMRKAGKLEHVSVKTYVASLERIGESRREWQNTLSERIAETD